MLSMFSVHSDRSRKCFAAADDVKLARLMLPQPAAAVTKPKYPGSYMAGRATSYQVKNSPNWRRRESRNAGCIDWQRSFCAGEWWCRSHSGRLRCSEVHRFTVFPPIVTAAGRKQQRGDKENECTMESFLQTVEGSLTHENVWEGKE